MPMTLLNNGAMLIDEETRAEATTVIDTACDHDIATFTVTAGGQEIAIPPALSRFLITVIERVSENRTMRIGTLPDELTTTAAAEMLGVSRPTLMKLIESGALPAKKVGSHNRVLTTDLSDLQSKRDAERAAAFSDVLRLSDEIDED